MRECDRCGMKISHGTLCHDCDIYLTSYCKGERDGRRLDRADMIEIVHKFFMEEMDKLDTYIDDNGVSEIYKDQKKAKYLLNLNKRLCNRLNGINIDCT